MFTEVFIEGCSLRCSLGQMFIDRSVHLGMCLLKEVFIQSCLLRMLRCRGPSLQAASQLEALEREMKEKMASSVKEVSLLLPSLPPSFLSCPPSLPPPSFTPFSLPPLFPRPHRRRSSRLRPRGLGTWPNTSRRSRGRNNWKTNLGQRCVD